MYFLYLQVISVVAAIIELSKYKLTIVTNTLGYVLENVSKVRELSLPFTLSQAFFS